MIKRKNPGFYVLEVRGFLGGVLRTLCFLSQEEAAAAAGEAFSSQREAVQVKIFNPSKRLVFSARRFFGHEGDPTVPRNPIAEPSRN